MSRKNGNFIRSSARNLLCLIPPGQQIGLGVHSIRFAAAYALSKNLSGTSRTCIACLSQTIFDLVVVLVNQFPVTPPHTHNFLREKCNAMLGNCIFFLLVNVIHNIDLILFGRQKDQNEYPTCGFIPS